MTIIDSISLFVIMVTLAIIPGTSVALVITRSATLGVANGIAVSLGIVLGDLIFILLAILGLSIVAETMGGFFLVIKYLAGAYLLWIGYTLLTSSTKNTITVSTGNTTGNFITSFLAGFFLTLGDIKAIFFYVSLFPAFIDPSILKLTDVFIIMLVTIVTVGGVKIAYAISARRAVTMTKGLKLEKAAKKFAGCFMIGAGSYLIVKA
ncbi:MAG: LysE family translocator [Gammaproteobacteria bacterium]|nr:LysE family translocator [Gammaproteobacteria bacterium]